MGIPRQSEATAYYGNLAGVKALRLPAGLRLTECRLTPRFFQAGNRQLIFGEQLLAQLFRTSRIALRRIRSALRSRLLQAGEKRQTRLALMDVAVHLLADRVVHETVHVIGERGK